MRTWILALAGAAYFIMAAPPNDATQNSPTEEALLMQAPQEAAPITMAISLCVDASTHEMGEAAVALFMADPTSGVLMGTGDEVAEPVETALALLGRHAVRA